MSVIIQGYQLRIGQFGQQIIKGPLVLPATGVTATIATVAGGSVLVTSMLGLVTTATTATSASLSIGTAPTVGTPQVAGIAAAAPITSLQVGTWIGALVNAGAAGTLVVGGTAGNAIFLPTPFLVSAGTITWTGSVGTNTGQIKWYFTYVPLDNGATLS
jgi:hypothetical protein